MRVACVQWHLSTADYLSGDRFARRLDPVMRRAVGPERRRREPVLVAFPECIGAPCVLVGESAAVFRANELKEAMEVLVRRHPLPVWSRRLRLRVGWPRAVLLARGNLARQTYERVFSAVARRYRAYIAAGSLLSPDGDGHDVHNVAYLFGPDGEVLLKQRKVHLIDLEGPDGLDLSPGDPADVEVVDTPFGRLGLAVCLDAFEEDVLLRLGELGCEMLVQPSANPQAWSPEQREDWLRGAAAAVRRKGGPRMVLNPMMVGSLFDLSFEGQTAIFAREGLRAEAILSGVRPGACGYMGLEPDPCCLAVAPPNREYVIAARLEG